MTDTAPLVTMDLTVVRVKAAEDLTVGTGPDSRVTCLAIDDNDGSSLELLRTVATQLPIGTRLTMTLSASTPHGVCTLHETGTVG